MKILFVDDEITAHEKLEGALKNTNYEPICTTNFGAALVKLNDDPEMIQVAIIDDNMEDSEATSFGNGRNFGKHIRQLYPHIGLLMLSRYDDLKTVREALCDSGFDYYLSKREFKYDEKNLIKALERITANVNVLIRRNYEAKKKENAILQDRLRTYAIITNTNIDEYQPSEFFNTEFIISTPYMKMVQRFIEIYSPTDETILITGESGTGKELIARALHYHPNSKRKEKPFVAINCAAIPDTLIESELFGYYKNAFFGANENTEGKFHIANGGTLFLDEIGDLSTSAQAKILRFLEGKKKEIKPLGHYKAGKKLKEEVDVRIVCATNKNLLKEIEEKKFREDLYFRISGLFPKTLPLRERKDDIPYLIGFFSGKCKIENPQITSEFNPDAINFLQNNYNWPGNVRELRNFTQKVLQLCPNEKLTQANIGNILGFWKEQHPHLLLNDESPLASISGKIRPEARNWMIKINEAYKNSLKSPKNFGRADLSKAFNVKPARISQLFTEYTNEFEALLEEKHFKDKISDLIELFKVSENKPFNQFKRYVT